LVLFCSVGDVHSKECGAGLAGGADEAVIQEAD